MEGDSRLMGADEAATVAALRGAGKVPDRLIGEHDGRIANTAGDSIIAVFDSAVEAVRTVAAIQAELAPLNAEISEDRQVRFRIGVNLGGICISRNIYDQVAD